MAHNVSLRSVEDADNETLCMMARDVTLSSKNATENDNLCFNSQPQFSSKECTKIDQMAPMSELISEDCCRMYDNLLFFFKFMFCKIHNLYGHENLRAYK